MKGDPRRGDLIMVYSNNIPGKLVLIGIVSQTGRDRSSQIRLKPGSWIKPYSAFRHKDAWEKNTGCATSYDPLDGDVIIKHNASIEDMERLMAAVRVI
jgi:hypothetical protein